MVLFPRIFSSDPKKYQTLARFLLAHKGIVMTNVRDFFTAGGRNDALIYKEIKYDVSQIIDRLIILKPACRKIITDLDKKLLSPYLGEEITKDSLKYETWVKLVCQEMDKKNLKRAYH